MSLTALESPRWSARRWISLIGTGIVAQLSLLLYFGERPEALPEPVRFRTSIYAAVDPWSVQALASMPTIRDPTLFALPSQQGFSGAAWLTFAPLEHRLSDWTEPLRWRALNAERLGETFARSAVTQTLPALRIADRPLPPPTGLDIPVPNVPVPEQTRLQVAGELAARPLVTPLPLQSWPHPDLLNRSVVQVLVDATGYPLTTALLEESGSPEADQYALAQAAAARFEPLRQPQGTPHPDLRLSWGALEFHWHILPPSATNTAVAPP